MKLQLIKDEAVCRYTSPSQRIRVMSELWLEEGMYCPACPSDIIKRFPNNKPVLDFFCPGCGEHYQLKSQAKPFTKRVTDGAYDSMMRAIETGGIPNFFFLHYDRSALSVLDLLLVPRFFFSASIIEKRKPLSLLARRAGWTGCNISYENLADEGKIKIVSKGDELQPEKVRESWRKVSFLKESNPKGKGWINDVLWCVNKLGKKEFSLIEMYSYEEHLRNLHPENRHIQPKIRQQLQVLRDKEIVQFLGDGRYRLID